MINFAGLEVGTLMRSKYNNNNIQHYEGDITQISPSKKEKGSIELYIIDCKAQKGMKKKREICVKIGRAHV